MQRFVVLAHDHPVPHWDLMLEQSSSLKTWRINSIEPRQPSSQTAVGLADHRLAYLTYEGPVSGNRGNVRQIDNGNYITQVWREDSIKCELHGSIFVGHIRLSLARAPNNEWQFIWVPLLADSSNES